MGKLDIITPKTPKTTKQLHELDKGELFIRECELDLYMITNIDINKNTIYDIDNKPVHTGWSGTITAISLNKSELRYFKPTVSVIPCTGKLEYITE